MKIRLNCEFSLCVQITLSVLTNVSLVSLCAYVNIFESTFVVSVCDFTLLRIAFVVFYVHLLWRCGWISIHVSPGPVHADRSRLREPLWVPTKTRKPSWRKCYARQQCVYEGPYGRNLSSARNPTLEHHVDQQNGCEVMAISYIQNGCQHRERDQLQTIGSYA